MNGRKEKEDNVDGTKISKIRTDQIMFVYRVGAYHCELRNASSDINMVFILYCIV